MRAVRLILLGGLLCVPLAVLADEIQKKVSDPVFHGEVHYRVSGLDTAPTVILVHGLGDKASSDWNGVSADLARDYRVVRFDLPGFGQSSKGNHAYTPDNYAKVLRSLVDRESRVRPFFLVGHSMGGAIALRYAALYPRDVKALVLVDVPAILHRSVYTKHMVAFGLSGLVPGLNLGENEFLGAKLGSMTGKLERLPVPIEMIVQLAPLRQRLLKGEPAKIAGLALALEDFSRDIDRVLTPTLLLWGDRDEIAPLRNGRMLAANLTNARLEVLPGSGHVPMDDAPSLFNKQLRAFLANPVMAERYNVLRDDGPLPVSTRRGRCIGQRGQVFEGDYERIDIEGCEAVVLRAVRAGTVRVVSSKVSIEDSRIGGASGGLMVETSRLLITSSRLEGDPAIAAADSRLDIAGSRLIGRAAAVTTRTTAELACSVCQVESARHHGALHGVRPVTPESPI